MKLDIDIKIILNGTPTYLVGWDSCKLDSVFITHFYYRGKEYKICGILEKPAGLALPVITDENDIIINKIKGI